MLAASVLAQSNTNNDNARPRSDTFYKHQSYKKCIIKQDIVDDQLQQVNQKLDTVALKWDKIEQLIQQRQTDTIPSINTSQDAIN